VSAALFSLPATLTCTVILTLSCLRATRDFFDMETAPLQARKEDITLAGDKSQGSQPTDMASQDDELFAEGRGDLLMSQPPTPRSQIKARPGASAEPELAPNFESPGMLRDAGNDLDLGLYDDGAAGIDLGGEYESMTGVAEHGMMSPEAGIGDSLVDGGEVDLGGGMDASPASPGAKRKRSKPVVDAVTEIPAKQIREQLQDTSNLQKEWVPMVQAGKKAKKKK